MFPSRILLSPDPLDGGGGPSLEEASASLLADLTALEEQGQPVDLSPPTGAPQPRQDRQPPPQGRNPGQRDAVPQGGPSQQGPQHIARQQAQADVQQPSFRDYIIQQGVNLDPSLVDEGSILNDLIGGARERDQLRQRIAQQDQNTRLGQAMAQRFLEQQPQAPAKTAERMPWQPPPFDQKWLALVELNRDTGMYIAKPGVPPDFAAKVNEYADWKEKMGTDPMGTMAPGIDKMITAQVEQRIAALTAQTQVQNTVNTILAENDPWLYAKDGQGRDIMAGGQRAITPVGQQYLSNLQWLRDRGMTDPRALDSTAKMYMATQLGQSQSPPPAVQTPAQKNALRAAAQSRNPLQTLAAQHRAGEPDATEPEAMDLGSMLEAAVADNGWDENTFFT